jgi:SAM-dependent methyltransferase
MGTESSSSTTRRPPGKPVPDFPGSPTPYAFEQIMRDSGGREPARLEAQNRLYEQQGPLDLIPPLPQDGRILDVGSGTGYWTVRLAGRVPCGRVVCLDRSPELLEHARTRLEQVGLHDAEYLNQDLRGLDLPAEAFDLVFTCMTLVHVVELEEVLVRLTRALKPGGWIACFEPVQDVRAMFEAYPPCPNLAFIVEQMAAVGRERGSDHAVGLKIAHALDRLGLEDTALRYFGAAPHGEELRAFVEDVYLSIARPYLIGRLNPDYLDRRLELALAEALRPGTWIDLKRTLILGRKPR